MPISSPFQLEIPASNLLDYIFPPNTTPSENPIWIDADSTTNSLSPARLLHWIKKLGAGLDNLQIPLGEPVMMFTRNHIFVPVFYYAVAGSGRVFTGCNTAYGVDELRYQLENTGAKLVLVEAMFLGTVLKAAEQSGLPKDRILLFSDKPCDETDGIKDWRTILGSDNEAERWRWPTMSAEKCKRTTAALNYSSGTTGLPKGVMISHQNIIANVEQSIFMRNLELPSGRAPPERWLGFLPMYHAYAQLWSISAALKTGTSCYVMREFSYERWLGHIEKHRITHVQTAPPLLVMLAKRPETKKYDISSLINVLCGAAPLSRELQNEVSEKCDLKVVQTWGMTEATCSCVHVPGGRDDRSGSVGYIDPGIEMKLINDEGKEVGPGERGEILARGPNICLGYWKNTEATHNAFDSEGYIRTGDIAIRDEAGWHWIVDRKKELIKVKGFQVAPAELEAVLLTNEYVADAAVCGIQRDYEELPRAYIVVKDASKGRMSERDVQLWVEERVARHKRLDGGVKFVDEVPKSSSGKIQRVIMRQWAKRDAEQGPKAKL